MTGILHLRSITCIQQAETFTDELYVTFNGKKRSLPNMTRGQTKTLSDRFLFVGSQALSLFENDGDHWYDRDDFIDKHTITEAPTDLTLIFKAKSINAGNARYALSVSITPDPPPVEMTATLRLNSIHCVQQAESFSDELYVTFNGIKRSLPNMTQGDTQLLSEEFVFVGSQALCLFENDGDHWYDRDDFITEHTITTQSLADLPLEFIATSGNAKGAHYVLNVSVVGHILV